MAEKVTLEKVNKKLKEGVEEFNKQPNVGKVIIVVAAIIILLLLLSYSKTLFFFGAGIWALYCWGKWLRTPKVEIRKVF